MKFTPVVEGRDFSSLSYQWPGVPEVARMRWHCYGGCREARITIPSVSERNEILQELYGLIRSPITIYDPFGDACWWGYIHEIAVPVGAWKVSLSVSDMANDVAVAYSYIQPGTNVVGQRRVTASAVDAGSQAEFGKKELFISQSGMTDTVAAQLRDGYLAAHRYPLVGYSPGGGSQAEIVCRGWWDTLGWRRASVPTVAAITQNTNTTNVGMGDAAARTRWVQQFTVGTQGINLLQLVLSIAKNGSPTDNVVIGIYALDTSGLPTGSALTSTTVAGTSLTGTETLYTLTLTEVKLAANTMYGIQVSRSGAVDGSNYYRFSESPNVYAGGVSYRYDGSAWQISSADFVFQILANNDVETSEQLRNILTNYGQFLSTVHVENASGVSTASYRDGETDALREAEDLMDVGTSNDRRLLAEVLQDRQVRIYEEPAKTAAYQFGADGRLYGVTGGMLDSWKPPVGNWVEFRDILGGSVDTERMIDPQIGFLEGASWTPSGETGKLTPEFRGQPTPADLAKVVIA